MSDDLNPVIRIESAFSPAGIQESKAALTGLADATNKLVPPTNAAAAAQGGLMAKQEVSRREVKILTAELLRSIGVSEGAGAAGRVAAEGFVAMGDAANYANLAMAGVGLVAITALPSLFAFIKGLASGDDEDAAKGAAEAAAKATDDLRTKIIDSLPALDSYARTLRPVPEYLQAWLKAARDLAFIDQGKKVEALAEQVEKLTGELFENERVLSLYRVINDAAGAGSEISRAKMDALTTTIREQKDEIAALNAEMIELAKAQNAHLTPAEMRKKSEEAATKAAQLAAKVDEENWKRATEIAAAKSKAWQEQDQQAAKTEKEREAEFAKAKEREVVEAEMAAVDAVRRRKERNDEIQFERDVAAAKRQGVEEEVAMGLHAGATAASLFTKNKSIAIAAAIADTYAGADKAFAQGGVYGFVSGALIIAQGLANVANIKGANPSGFDDPRNDLMAEQRGGKWAADLLFRLDKGFNDALNRAPFGGAGVTNNHYPSTNNYIDRSSYHSHAIVGSAATRELMNLKRKLVTVDRNYNRGKIGGNS